MLLNRAERFMIANQLKILSRFEERDGEAGSFAEKIEALESGYELEYDRIAEGMGISESVLNSDECREVWDTLQMFDSIRCSMDRLGLSSIENHEHRFRGYSGNDETLFMAYSQYIVEHRNRFLELELINPQDHGGFNSHLPMREKYHAMRAVWGQIPSNQLFSQTNEQVVQLLSAR